MSDQPSLFGEPPAPRTVDPTTTAYVTTTELTLEELQALARGEVTPDLQAFAKDWLFQVTATNADWIARIHAQHEQKRSA